MENSGIFKVKEIVILWGLPGSGKSFHALELEKEFKEFLETLTYSDRRYSYFKIIDLDYKFRHGWKSMSKDNKLEELAVEIYWLMKDSHSPHTTIVLDGLITTNEQVIDILITIKSKLFELEEVPKYKIIHWEEDRESCLFNDAGRRSVNSTATITHAPLEIPNLEALSILGIKKEDIIMKKVIKKPLINKLVLESGIDEYSIKDGELRSRSWSMGGTYGNYLGDHGTVDADSPLEFEEFDTLMEHISPDITFLKYKKIMRECCRVDTKGEGDYYGGHTTHASHVCDLNKLYSMLVEMEILK